MPAVGVFVRGIREWDATEDIREGLRSMSVSREWQNQNVYWRGCLRD